MYLGGCFFRQKTLMVPWFERHQVGGFKALSTSLRSRLVHCPKHGDSANIGI